MERITISLDDTLAERFDVLIRSMGYSNRSEAMRDLIRDTLTEHTTVARNDGDCIATLSYVYNHHALDLAERLIGAQHAHHELTHSTLHVHLDHDSCLEVTVLQGKTSEVREFAEAVISQKGVHHGNLQVIPVQLNAPDHHHPHDHDHGHSHASPQV